MGAAPPILRIFPSERCFHPKKNQKKGKDLSRKRAGEKRKRNNWGLTCARNVKIKEIRIQKKKGKKEK